jgi:hypothetical protein
MIRLLEIAKLEGTNFDYKRHEVDTGLGHNSTIGNVSGPEVHLREM